MKRILILGIIMTALLSCSQKNDRNIKNNGDSFQVQSNGLDVKVENDSSVVILLIEGIKAGYNPISLKHKIYSDAVEILTLEDVKVATIKHVDNNNSSIVDDTSANALVSIIKGTKKLEIEIFDIDRAHDLLRHNLHDSLATNIGTLVGDEILVTKDQESRDLKNYVDPPFEAPIQNLVISRAFGMKQIGTPVFWHDKKLKMVKAQKRDSLSFAKFDVLESIDLMNSLSSDFTVSLVKSSINDNYEKLEITIQNKNDDGAFVTSNPVDGIGSRCIGLINSTNITGVRIENGIKYSVAFKKGYLDECLSFKHKKQQIYIYDELLNYLEVLY